ncbi:MAG: GNAT family N-acetyltransferase [Nocardioides sp.]
MSTRSATAYPQRTERLLVRIMCSTDAPVFAAYRSPEVARHQLWDLPYTLADATEVLASQDEQDDLVLGGWTQLAVEHDGEVVGDVCAHVDETGWLAEIGFTLAREHQGRGFATEAATALVTDLVERVGVGRVVGELDPVNVASQRVLESIGLDYEATTLKSFRWRGEWTDNRATAPPPTSGAPGGTGRPARLARCGWCRWGWRTARPTTTCAPTTPRSASSRRCRSRSPTHSSPRSSTARRWSPDVRRRGRRRGGGVRDAHGRDPGAPGAVLVAAARRPAAPAARHRRSRPGPGGRPAAGGGRDRPGDQLAGRGRGPRPFYLRYGFAETGRLIDGEHEARLALGG